ncbi:aminotransferase class IV [Bacillota bacterium LX-D]|nr:aminotransferase class IV [Bacillota bacterium LX-D]
MYISLNGNLLKKQHAAISPLSESVLYGYGLFETIKVSQQKMFFFPEHFERLKAGSEDLNIPLKFSQELIYKYCHELILENQLIDGALRIAHNRNDDGSYLIITTSARTYLPDAYAKGFKLCIAETQRNPNSLLVGIKSNNYLENILIRQQAVKQGYDEAIFLNAFRQVCEGTISNIFFVKDTVVYTPDIRCGLLPGIVRSKVIKLVKQLNLEVELGSFEQEILLNADEIFVTNSLLEIMPVSQFANKTFDLNNYPITKNIRETYELLYKCG